jgi:hypothetical protein
MGVIIGMDPHNRSATIEVIDERENALGQGRFDTDSHGYRTMLAVGRRFQQRIWAVEGCNGIARHIAQRLVADGETGLDVPAKQCFPAFDLGLAARWALARPGTALPDLHSSSHVDVREQIADTLTDILSDAGVSYGLGPLTVRTGIKVVDARPFPPAAVEDAARVRAADGDDRGSQGRSIAVCRGDPCRLAVLGSRACKDTGTRTRAISAISAVYMGGEHPQVMADGVRGDRIDRVDRLRLSGPPASTPSGVSAAAYADVPTGTGLVSSAPREGEAGCASARQAGAAAPAPPGSVRAATFGVRRRHQARPGGAHGRRSRPNGQPPDARKESPDDRNAAASAKPSTLPSRTFRCNGSDASRGTTTADGRNGFSR